VKRRIYHERECGTRQEIADIFQFPHPGHGIAGTPGLKIRDRKRNQMLEQPRTQLDIDPVGSMCEDIGSQRAKHRFEDRDSDKADYKDVKGRETAMSQHFIGDNLKKQRRHKPKELQEK